MRGGVNFNPNIRPPSMPMGTRPPSQMVHNFSRPPPPIPSQRGQYFPRGRGGGDYRGNFRGRRGRGVFQPQQRRQPMRERPIPPDQQLHVKIPTTTPNMQQEAEATISRGQVLLDSINKSG